MTTPCTLVSIPTPDSLLLPGLLYEPDLPKSNKKHAVIFLHGNGSSGVFYSVERANAIAQACVERGVAYLPFNNRGAHYIQNVKKTVPSENPGEPPEIEKVRMGTAYELIADCVHDIDGAIAFLAQNGYTEFTLAGMSTGANKICWYHYHKKQTKAKNLVSRYILLCGGDDTGLYYDMLGKEDFTSALERSREKVKAGKGMELVDGNLAGLTGGLMSWQSLYDTINPDGEYNIFPFNEYFNRLNLSTKPLFREYASIDIPTLVVYGQEDEFCYGRVDDIVALLKEKAGHSEGYDASGPSFEFRVIPGADHGFTGFERELGEMIGKFVA